MRNHQLIIAAFASAAVLPTAAIAGPVNETRFAEDVTHADLDLATRHGAARLEDRVRNRIRHLCQNGGRDGASLRLERECRMSALANADHKVRVAVADARIDRVRLAAAPALAPEG